MTRYSFVALAGMLALAASATGYAQQRAAVRATGEGFISEGIPKMPNPPGPAPKQELSGAGWGLPTPTSPMRCRR